MQTLSHSQAHALGDLGSVGATAGRIARLNEARALKASEAALYDGSLQAMRSVSQSPSRVHGYMKELNSALERDPQFQVGHGNYAIRCAVLECLCAIEAEMGIDESEGAPA